MDEETLLLIGELKAKMEQHEEALKNLLNVSEAHSIRLDGHNQELQEVETRLKEEIASTMASINDVETHVENVETEHFELQHEVEEHQEEHHEEEDTPTSDVVEVNVNPSPDEEKDTTEDAKKESEQPTEPTSTPRTHKHRPSIWGVR